MRIDASVLVDRGVWVSDDWVYAFVMAGGSIAEVGYHGAQPVSRNSIILSHPPGALTLSVQSADGATHHLQCEEFDWQAGLVSFDGSTTAGDVHVVITAAGREIVVETSTVDASIRSLQLTFDIRALFTKVQGTRTWGKARVSDEVVIPFRDRILLGEWMKRTGPYAGDFLIPEPVRRRIFKRPCRSGTATIDDLRPEFRDSQFALYDVEQQVRLGGEGWKCREESDRIVFERVCTGQRAESAEFRISFGDAAETPSPPPDKVPIHSVRKRHERLLAGAPKAGLPGYPEIERFFQAAPSLVESCTVRDLGVPRATPGRYYWIWAWDAMVTALASLRFGRGDLARQTIEFVNDHRDDGGLIPMRWTRALEPLDTQPRGALETLLASLAYSASLEAKDTAIIRSLYPAMRQHFAELSAECNEIGLFRNIGFYPDVPGRFGRSESSAVALECGAFYTFCRTFENVAIRLNDTEAASRARDTAAAVERSFRKTFWNESKGFFIDSVDLGSGSRNESFPLFTLLFLHSSLGLSLIRPVLDRCAGFIAGQLLTPYGLRVLAPWDRNAGSETISRSTYPHWDQYALKILRRAGHVDPILTWLRAVERVLSRLGYVPEYLELEGLDQESGWLRHGSPSNLNCVTGWYNALLEGVFGLETDPGGITIIPLSLFAGTVDLRGMVFRGSKWTVNVTHDGKHLNGIFIDGTPLHGCLKIPAGYCDDREHLLEIRYGTGIPGPRFLEIVNAEVLEVKKEGIRVSARIRALGQMEVVFQCSGDGRLLLDDVPVSGIALLSDGRQFKSLSIVGEHTLTIEEKG